MVALTGVCIPNLGFAIERAGDDFVAVWIVESHRVDNICMLIEREELLARVSVPNLASSIIATSDESAAALVEGAIC